MCRRLCLAKLEKGRIIVVKYSRFCVFGDKGAIMRVDRMAKVNKMKKTEKKKSNKKQARRTTKKQETGLGIMEGIDLNLDDATEDKSLKLAQKEPEDRREAVRRQLAGGVMLLVTVIVMLILGLSGWLMGIVRLIEVAFEGIETIVRRAVGGTAAGVVCHPGEDCWDVADMPELLLILGLVTVGVMLVVLVVAAGGRLLAKKEVPGWIWYTIVGLAMATILLMGVWWYVMWLLMLLGGEMQISTGINAWLILATLSLVLGNILSFTIGVRIMRKIHTRRHPEGIVEKV